MFEVQQPQLVPVALVFFGCAVFMLYAHGALRQALRRVGRAPGFLEQGLLFASAIRYLRFRKQIGTRKLDLLALGDLACPFIMLAAGLLGFVFAG